VLLRPLGHTTGKYVTGRSGALAAGFPFAEQTAPDLAVSGV
jgi:hypothetical protein